MGWTQPWGLVSLGWGISDQPGHWPAAARLAVKPVSDRGQHHPAGFTPRAAGALRHISGSAPRHRLDGRRILPSHVSPCLISWPESNEPKRIHRGHTPENRHPPLKVVSENGEMAEQEVHGHVSPSPPG
jgi:hypothetical protein